METLDTLSPILPIDCFHVCLPLNRVEKGAWKKHHLLPDFSDLLIEHSFAKVSMGYSEKGLFFQIEVGQGFQDCFFPDYRKGDSVELFLDTRDLKTAGFLTKFCHHFVFLPQVVDGVGAQEVTAFRSEDRHELCDGAKLKGKGKFKKNSYTLEIEIPAECLVGYDPNSFDRLGFTYRINRVSGDPQHFALSSDYLSIEKEPKRWSSMQYEV